MANYLLEIGTEEIPARFMPNILADYKTIFSNALKENRIGFDEVITLGTPRRVAIMIKGIAEEQEALSEEVKGPAAKIAYDENKNPSKALKGFMRGNQLTEADIFTKELNGALYIFGKKNAAGEATKKVLSELLPKLIMSIHFPKTMRWGANTMRFVRPLQWLVSLWDNEELQFTLDEMTSGRQSKGHRFLSNEWVAIEQVEAYAETMKEHYVIVDPEVREKMILSQIAELDQAHGTKTVVDAELLSEVVYLVEYPEALMGNFDKKYLEIPEGLVVTPMREHQRYFPVRNSEGVLLNHFVTVRNGTKKHIEIVQHGNEKVLEARLADAKFFYDEDLKHPLADNLDKLKKIVFQEKLGTVYEKMERVYALSKTIGEALGETNETIVRAQEGARLLKADLVSNVVMEFPELQGIMGEEYAAKTMNVHPLVAQSIREHYMPRFAGDDVPASAEGSIVSLADKMDTIVGCFAAGIEPTGSQDPYALRRQAMGVVQILVQRKVHTSLHKLIVESLNGFVGKLEIDLPSLTDKIYEFFYQRVLTLLKDGAYDIEFIRAILAVGYDDPYEVMIRAKEIKAWMATPGFSVVDKVYNRVYNLTYKHQPIAVVDVYQNAEEKALSEDVSAIAAKENRLWENAQALEEVSNRFDEYLENTMIMVDDEDLRKERLSVLAQYLNLFVNTVDLSLL